MLSLKPALVVVAFALLGSVSCGRLPFTWGKKGDNDLLICSSDRYYDSPADDRPKVGYVASYRCKLPEGYKEFTYVQVWAERASRDPDDFRISQIHDTTNKYMYFEVESKHTFHVHFRFYGKKIGW